MEPEVIRLVDAAARAVGVLRALAMVDQAMEYIAGSKYIRDEAAKLEEAVNDVTRKI
jgi:hypothetical protein